MSSIFVIVILKHQQKTKSKIISSTQQIFLYSYLSFTCDADYEKGNNKQNKVEKKLQFTTINFIDKSQLREYISNQTFFFLVPSQTI